MTLQNVVFWLDPGSRPTNASEEPMYRTLFVCFCLLLPVATSFADDAGPGQLAHMVFFTLADDTATNRKQLVQACHEYLTGHEGTTHFSAGTVAEDLQREVNDRDFHVALHLVFASKKAHDKYQTHPRHLKFIEKNKHLWKTVRVFDSYVDSAAKPSVKLDELLSAKLSIRAPQLSLVSFVKAIEKEFNESHPKLAPLHIEIRGRDLQTEGITQNQMLRNFVATDESLANVLTKMVSKANPIDVEAPNDPKHLLVWVPSPDGKSILITTRAVASQKNYDLPKVFRKK